MSSHPEADPTCTVEFDRKLVEKTMAEVLHDKLLARKVHEAAVIFTDAVNEAQAAGLAVKIELIKLKQLSTLPGGLLVTTVMNVAVRKPL